MIPDLNSSPCESVDDDIPVALNGDLSITYLLSFIKSCSVVFLFLVTT